MPDHGAGTPVPRSPLQVSDEKYSATLNDGAQPAVRFRGTISTPNPALLVNPFVESAHRALAAKRLRHVDVDLRELEFCNSSGFKSFIYWIELIKRLPEGERYKLRFLVSPVRRWQRTSLLALSCFATDLTEIVA